MRTRTDDPDLLRTVRFTPYRKGLGPSFTLRTWDTNSTIGGKYRLRYELRQHEKGQTVILFAGDDFGCSPLHAIDADDTLAGIMTFLTLRPGDTDAEYFEGYTEAQREFCREHAEVLAGAVMDRWPDR